MLVWKLCWQAYHETCSSQNINNGKDGNKLNGRHLGYFWLCLIQFNKEDTEERLNTHCYCLQILFLTSMKEMAKSFTSTIINLICRLYFAFIVLLTSSFSASPASFVSSLIVVKSRMLYPWMNSSNRIQHSLVMKCEWSHWIARSTYLHMLLTYHLNVIHCLWIGCVPLNTVHH